MPELLRLASSKRRHTGADKGRGKKSQESGWRSEGPNVRGQRAADVNGPNGWHAWAESPIIVSTIQGQSSAIGWRRGRVCAGGRTIGADALAMQRQHAALGSARGEAYLAVLVNQGRKLASRRIHVTTGERVALGQRIFGSLKRL